MATVADIFKARQRKQNTTEGKNGETLSVSPEKSDHVYISKCKSCTFTVETVAAKCLVERCDDTTVKFTERLIAGTLELYGCNNVSVYVSPTDMLPSVVIDQCSNIDLYFHQPKLLHKIYTVACKNVVIHLEPPYKKEQALEFPYDLEDNEQCITSYYQGKLLTEKMLRAGGGYPTTAREQQLAEQRERLMEQHVQKMLQGMLSRPRDRAPAVEKPDKPVEKPADKPVEKPDKPADDASQSPPDEDIKPPPSLVTGDALLSAKDKLKPTETVERHVPVVGTGAGKGGFNPAISDDEDKKEYFDTPEELNSKLNQLVEWVKTSKHCIMFTGAGISTSAGIPDFRSGMDTVLETGPGVWEQRAHADQPVKKANIVNLIKALPSTTHMGIVQLHKNNLVKFTVSQNVDGLHRRSGLGSRELAELHGNTNLEHCKKCGREYMRDFETREAIGVFNHETSRECDNPKCRGQLHDSIINFGESLPKEELDKAFMNADKADLCIVMGSSLRVSPACDIPRVVSTHGKLVICNLQKTPLHSMADINLHAKCDEVMDGLLKRLNLEAEPFKLQRRVEIKSTKNQSGSELVVTGVDVKDNTPYSFLKGISLQLSSDDEILRTTDEPLTLNLPVCGSGTVLPVQLYFHGHYGEPSLIIKHMLNTTFQYLMTYNPQDGKWFYQVIRT